MNTPDNLYIYNEYEADRYRTSRPICRRCGEPITSDKAYDVDGLWCQECFNAWIEEIQYYMD